MSSFIGFQIQSSTMATSIKLTTIFPLPCSVRKDQLKYGLHVRQLNSQIQKRLTVQRKKIKQQ